MAEHPAWLHLSVTSVFQVYSTGKFNSETEGTCMSQPSWSGRS